MLYKKSNKMAHIEKKNKVKFWLYEIRIQFLFHLSKCCQIVVKSIEANNYKQKENEIYKQIQRNNIETIDTRFASANEIFVNMLLFLCGERLFF